ncbi:ROK family protein [Limnochorda pilosa]|uniref:ROK family protein n=1 Tax=Limnochorda pilosa TaxID=1555112 RepID=UPI0034E958E9
MAERPKSSRSRTRFHSSMPIEKPTRLSDLRIQHASLVLTALRLNGPLSRAQLARQIGLSQPTVSAIVEELLHLDLVVEKGEGPSTGGRRPTLLGLGGERLYVLAMDLGGTRMKMGLVNLQGRLLASQAVPTPGSGRNGTTRLDPQQILEGVVAHLKRFMDEVAVPKDRILALGLGLPGVTDPERGIVTLAPALGWVDMPVVKVMEDLLGMPVFVENDVNAAALAEQRYGQGRRMRNFVFVALGTGVGAGLILEGRLYRGHANAAGEVGYLAIDRDWIRAHTSTRTSPGDAFGCWESLSAAPAIERMARELLSQHERADASILQSTELTAEAVMDAAAQGDPVGRAVLDQLAENLALGLTNIVVLLDPEAIILGGGVSLAGDLLRDAVQDRLVQTSPFVPELLISELGEQAGLLGAAAVAVEGIVPLTIARGGHKGMSREVMDDS